MTFGTGGIPVRPLLTRAGRHRTNSRGWALTPLRDLTISSATQAAIAPTLFFKASS